MLIKLQVVLCSFELAIEVVEETFPYRDRRRQKGEVATTNEVANRKTAMKCIWMFNELG